MRYSNYNTFCYSCPHCHADIVFLLHELLDTVCAFGLDLHSVCTYNTLMPLCSNLLLCYCGSLPNYLVLFFYYLSHSVLSLFTLSFIVWFCSLQRLGARQWPCYLDYCGPLNVQQLVLVEATQNTHNSVLSQQGRQVTLSELEAQTILFL